MEVDHADRALLNAAMARGVNEVEPPKKGREPRRPREQHVEHAESWVRNIKRIAEMYEQFKAGRLVLRFVADENHPMNPDTMEILRVPVR